MKIEYSEEECGDGGLKPCKTCGGHPCPRCNAPHPSEGDGIWIDEVGDVCLPCATDEETRQAYFINDLLGGYMTRKEMLEQYPERKHEIDNSRNPYMREGYQYKGLVSRQVDVPNLNKGEEE